MLADDIFLPPTDIVGVDPIAVSVGGFGAFGVLFAIAFVGTLIFIIVVAVRKYSVLDKAGIDPLTVDAQIAAKILTSDALKSTPSAPSVEERLAHLDDLYRRGVITLEERATARSEILRE